MADHECVVKMAGLDKYMTEDFLLKGVCFLYQTEKINRYFNNKQKLLSNFSRRLTFAPEMKTNIVRKKYLIKDRCWVGT